MVDLSTWSLSASKQVSYLTLVGFSYHLLSEWLYLEGKFVFWKPIFSKKPYWCLFIYVDIVAVWVICCYMKYDSRLQLKQPMCYLLCSMGQEFGYSLAVFSVSGSQKGASKLSAGAAFYLRLRFASQLTWCGQHSVTNGLSNRRPQFLPGFWLEAILSFLPFGPSWRPFLLLTQGYSPNKGAF